MNGSKKIERFINMDKLQQIYDDAGRPGAQAFRFAVRRAGLQISDAEARAFVSRQSAGQVFRGRIRSDGKIVGGGREDQRWQMDSTIGQARSLGATSQDISLDLGAGAVRLL